MTLVTFHASQQSVTQVFVGLHLPDPKMEKKAQDSSSLAEGCSPVSLLSSSLSIHARIQQCGKLRWAAPTELLYKTSLNYQQSNSDTLEVIPATSTQGFVHLLTVLPNHILAEFLVHIQCLNL